MEGCRRNKTDGEVRRQLSRGVSNQQCGNNLDSQWNIIKTMMKCKWWTRQRECRRCFAAIRYVAGNRLNVLTHARRHHHDTCQSMLSHGTAVVRYDWRTHLYANTNGEQQINLGSTVGSAEWVSGDVGQFLKWLFKL